MNHHLAAPTEFFNRLTTHAQTGGLLEGLTLNLESSVVGENQLPGLLVTGWSSTEGVAVGANIPVDTKITVTLTLLTSRRDGWHTSIGTMRWTFAIQDALECATNGTPDPLFNGLLRRPLIFRISGDSAVDELSISTQITVEMNVYPVCRGRRIFEDA